MANDVIVTRHLSTVGQEVPRINKASKQAAGLEAWMPYALPQELSQRRGASASVSMPPVSIQDGVKANAYGDATTFTTKINSVQIDNFPFLDKFTLCCRLYYNNSGASYRALISRGAIFENNTNFCLSVRTSTVRRVALYARNGATLLGNESTATDFAPNTWVDIVATWESGSLAIYLDGQLKVTDTDLLGADGSQPLIFGAPNSFASTDVNAFGNLMYDARVYSRIWSAEEVIAYTKPRTRFELWKPPSRLFIPGPAAAPTGFQAAWAARSTTTISGAAMA